MGRGVLHVNVPRHDIHMTMMDKEIPGSMA